jgi:hypothetical protein
MDWLTREPPSEVDICGEAVPIRVGWRRSVRSLALQGDGRMLSVRDRAALVASWFMRDGELPATVESHPNEALDAAFGWRDVALSEAMPYGDGSQTTSGTRVFDWEDDSGIVRVDFLRSYGIDLREWQGHWYTFALLFCGICAVESLTSTAMTARRELPRKSDRWERERHDELSRAWALPPTEAELTKRMREAF